MANIPTSKFNISVLGLKDYQFSLDRLGDLVSFLGKDTWDKVVEVFYKAEKVVFSSEGSPEGFAALSPKYAEWKARNFPGKKIMQRTGALEEALTGTGATPGMAVPIKKYVNNKTAQGITMGVRSPYAKAHQEGLGHLPVRKVMQVTHAERIQFAKVLQVALVTIERQSWGGLKA